jgi:hypothetical protein
LNELAIQQNFTSASPPLHCAEGGGRSYIGLPAIPAEEGEQMNSTSRWWLAAVAGLALTLTTVPNALAKCGQPATMGHPASWDVPSGPAQLTPAAFGGNFRTVGEEVDPIVGMWHVIFTAEGNGSAGPPDKTPIDNAMAVWHSDKTEIMNSGRPAQDGDFCLGVWEALGQCKYKLNHFAWGGNDTTNAPGGIGKPLFATHVAEEVVLSPDGKSFSGTFTLDAYDTSFNSAGHIVGVIKGTRVTTSTTIEELE